jgi:predicted RNA-binding Zn-ribbon protein involved in translation (DUF1610 family)
MEQKQKYGHKLRCDYCGTHTLIRKFLFNPEQGYTRFICINCDDETIPR